MKKSFKIMAAAAMAFALSLGSISALGSVTKNGAVSDEIIIDGKKVEKDSVKAGFKTTFDKTVVSAAVVTEIEQLNENPTKLLEVLNNEKVNLPAGDGVKMEHVAMLTSIQNLELIDQTTGEPIKDAKNVTMTWEVPNLTTNAGVIRILHYSTVRNVWELLIPDAVDYSTKSVTVTFPDLSPVAVVYVPKDKVSEIGNIKDYGNGSKPNDIIKGTAEVVETKNNSIYYMSGLAILAGAAVYLFKRKANA